LTKKLLCAIVYTEVSRFGKIFYHNLKRYHNLFSLLIIPQTYLPTKKKEAYFSLWLIPSGAALTTERNNL